MIGCARLLAEKTPPYDPRAGAHLRLGLRGEEEAARHLARRGYRILERRFRTRAGEIDLVARDGATLVFVEVKTRSTLAFGRPAEAVGIRERARIAAAAALYLASRAAPGPPACRFDVIEVLLGRYGEPPRIRHIRAAFEAS